METDRKTRPPIEPGPRLQIEALAKSWVEPFPDLTSQTVATLPFMGARARIRVLWLALSANRGLLPKLRALDLQRGAGTGNRMAARVRLAVGALYHFATQCGEPEVRSYAAKSIGATLSFSYMAGEYHDALHDAVGGDVDAIHTLRLMASDLPSLERGVDPAILFDLPWRIRETARFANGYYEALPWDISAIGDHYAHIARTGAQMVAFTASEAHGEADRQTAVKPGRYLTKFYPAMNPDAVRELQAQIGVLDVRFATSPEEIVGVYERGPKSCMSHPQKAYVYGNPVVVYGNSDLQLAYITDAKGKPTARALVWPEKKIHGRVYGDEDRLKHRLREKGFTRGRLEGARIRRIEKPNGDLVVPYIDDLCAFDVVDDNWLQIGGGISFDGTTGSYPKRKVGRPCAHCDEPIDTTDDEAVSVDGATWHGECATDHDDTEECECCGGWTLRGTSSVNRDWGTQSMCQSCVENNTFRCEGSEEWFASDDFEPVHLLDGTCWSSDWFDEHGITIDGERYDRDDPARPMTPEEETEKGIIPHSELGVITASHDVTLLGRAVETNHPFYRVLDAVLSLSYVNADVNSITYCAQANPRKAKTGDLVVATTGFVRVEIASPVVERSQE